MIGQSLSLLVNSFSKWPEELACRQATLSVADEVVRRPDQLSYSPQGLANLVNGFNKWPDQAATRRATVTIAGEVCRRAPRLSDCTSRELANLDGFSKYPWMRGKPQLRLLVRSLAAPIVFFSSLTSIWQTLRTASVGAQKIGRRSYHRASA
ncbi:hypothetical protein QA640_39615 [Bradyrhizobium sp. CB82]|uniref:hypothetical protein n=1 Tax=Bradyrhizobium sp. CB82 TaxID=3039159 RepID=UPI0024B0B5C7|nr:hypothetical protein [Bradyrhizobium sp. CB82]WFU40243.1 hypothetical protein QA640_39615 [Bradyrhizobium sp. CB82]